MPAHPRPFHNKLLLCAKTITLSSRTGTSRSRMDLVVSDMSAMGEEKIHALKDIGPK
ncbi:hypothetical protein Lalb_Chr04g0255841 [Lupinus albus]|uniref:Uncharacterized protein n=1 Tax=Lupinus albus TaxID=3870 RepID=A0A6A4QPM6_LUPAL|nr:hypothetical protein Lalb_Chr04g0255841 [Lupinus albus]